MLFEQEAKPAKPLPGIRDPLKGWRDKARGQADPDSLPPMLTPYELPDEWLHLGSLSFAVQVGTLPVASTPGVTACWLEKHIAIKIPLPDIFLRLRVTEPLHQPGN